MVKDSLKGRIEAAAGDDFYKCSHCGHTYVIECITLSGGRLKARGFDLTKGAFAGLTASCVESGLATTSTLTADEARNFAKYEGRRKRS